MVVVRGLAFGIVIAVLAYITVCAESREAQDDRETRLRENVYALCADEFAGRRVGTPECDGVIAYLEEQLTAIGVQPLPDSLFDPRIVRQAQIIIRAENQLLLAGNLDLPACPAIQHDHLPPQMLLLELLQFFFVPIKIHALL